MWRCPGSSATTGVFPPSLYFVAAFFGGRHRALWARLVSLAMYMRTIFAFNYTVVATGA